MGELGVNQQALLRALQISKEIIIITDAQGLITWVNDGFVKMSEYTLEEIKGRKPGSFLQGSETDQKVVDRMREAINQGENLECRVINYSKSGHKYMIQLNIIPIYENGVLTSFVGLEHDVSEHHREVNQKKLMIEKYQQENELRNKLIALINHDLRNPINEIFGIHQIIQLNPDSFDHYFPLIKNSLENMLKLSNNINLIFYQNQESNTRIKVKQLINQVIKNHTSQSAIKLIKVNNLVSSRSRIRFNPGYLEIILGNLLSNAIKFSDQKSEIDFVFDRKRISVIDRGVGMSRKTKRQINGNHSIDRINSTLGTQGERGSGLGLVLCKYLLKSQGYHFHIKSGSKCGTTISLVKDSIKD